MAILEGRSEHGLCVSMKNIIPGAVWYHSLWKMPLRKKGKSSSTNSLNKGSTSTLSTGEEKWKEVQMRVYTGWVNNKLSQGKTDHAPVKNLTKELGDGVLLIKLLELLSGKKVPGK